MCEDDERGGLFLQSFPSHNAQALYSVFLDIFTPQKKTVLLQWLEYD
jgi:hypothetical protein